MKKLALIHPRYGDEKKDRQEFAPLNIALLAALTPEDDFEVFLIDENVQDIDPEEHFDLVGISVMTPVAPRAYEISNMFRDKKIPVVLGGIHVTARPEEALKYADSIVIGEAENVWDTLIKDFQRGNLQERYGPADLADLNNLPIPKREKLPDYYNYRNVIETTRSCPYSCLFCSCNRLKFRLRKVDNVLKEVEHIVNQGDKRIAFADNDIVANTLHAKELFEKLIPYKIEWVAFSRVAIADDIELLEKARESGCKELFIGFESLNSENLRYLNKIQYPNRYFEQIKRIHKADIDVHASFMFGLDYDDERSFKRIINFRKQAWFTDLDYYILTPFPATEIYEKLIEEGRLSEPKEEEWSKYNGEHVVFQTRMSVKTLLRRQKEALRYKSYNESPKSQQRNYLRTKRRFPVTVTWKPQSRMKLSDNNELNILTNDIGGGGFSADISRNTRIPEETTLQLALTLPNPFNRIVCCKGERRWQEQINRDINFQQVGIRFTEIEDSDRSNIIKFVTCNLEFADS